MRVLSFPSVIAKKDPSRRVIFNPIGVPEIFSKPLSLSCMYALAPYVPEALKVILILIIEDGQRDTVYIIA